MPLTLVDTYQFTDYSDIHRFPVSLTTGHLVFEASSVQGESFKWLRAGTLIEVAELDIGVECRGWKKRLYFERIAVTMQPLKVPFQLEFIPQKWVHDALIKLWTYDDAPEVVVTTVPARTVEVTLVEFSPTRRGVAIYNDSPATLYISLGATVTTAFYDLVIQPGGYYETPFGYNGQIVGVWSAAIDDATVQEFF